MMNLEETYQNKKVEMLLEAITIEDLKKFSNIFSTIENAISGFNLPSIENVLELSRNNLSSLMNKAKKEVKPGTSKQNMAGLISSVPPKAAKSRRVLLGRLIALQTSLVKLLRAIPTLMPLVSKEIKIEGKEIKIEGKEKEENLINEMTAAELATDLGVPFSKIQRDTGLQGDDEVEPEVEQQLRDEVEHRSQFTSKEKRKIAVILGKDGIQRFRTQIENALNIKKGFMNRILNSIGFGDDLEKVLNPQNIVNDLINLTYEEFKSFATQANQVKNIQVGISQQDAQNFARTTTQQDSTAADSATSSEKRQDVTKITTDELYKSWSDPRIFPGLQSIKKSTLKQMLNGLRGKTIV